MITRCTHYLIVVLATINTIAYLFFFKSSQYNLGFYGMHCLSERRCMRVMPIGGARVCPDAS